MGFPLLQTQASKIIFQFIKLHLNFKNEIFLLFDIIHFIELFPTSELFGLLIVDLKRLLNKNEKLNNGYILSKEMYNIK